ncbi:hypothetical protein SCLCIDRAFT_493037 [Scleroderma citrinum Foug A]|uniref:Secreted protein n=1 Tax=Scleroderma citrinum Foug A TaxID=1036808 RepID=A0A0C3AY74_9AGAM|nr:hypothetical protein SCLCIDRAFT_493037 [Scleroderma citrinum Foug A]
MLLSTLWVLSQTGVAGRTHRVSREARENSYPDVGYKYRYDLRRRVSHIDNQGRTAQTARRSSMESLTSWAVRGRRAHTYTTL